MLVLIYSHMGCLLSVSFLDCPHLTLCLSVFTPLDYYLNTLVLSVNLLLCWYSLSILFAIVMIYDSSICVYLHHYWSFFYPSFRLFLCSSWFQTCLLSILCSWHLNLFTIVMIYWLFRLHKSIAFSFSIRTSNLLSIILCFDI